MQIKVRDGGFFPPNHPHYLLQVWTEYAPEVMQTASFAGQEMIAIIDVAGGFQLEYLGHKADGFTSIEDAKTAAPEFAIAVLERMRTLIQGK